MLVESSLPVANKTLFCDEPRLPCSTELHQVLLVPGFFGFGSLGEIGYFNGVREALGRSFEKLGLTVVIHEVETLPTASIRKRAAHLLEALAAVAEQAPGPLHIIGHSTGGLDARLAIAPTASLPTQVRFTAYERVRTLVTICCPHFGTPLATYFTSRLGRALFRWVTGWCIFLLERGRLPLAILLRLGYFVVRLRDPRRRRQGTFDELYEKLLNHLSEARRLELVHFLRAISSDQALLFQLTPAGCDLLNACTAEPAVRYGCVVARARPATLQSLLRSVWDLYSQIMHPVYAVLQRLSGRSEGDLIPAPVGAQRDKLVAMLGELPKASDSDGVVPLHSQVWGAIIHATRGDHLDVVGQYGSRSENSWGGDWLPSYSGFEATRFAALWRDVAGFIAGDSAMVEEARQRRDDSQRTAGEMPPAAFEGTNSLHPC